MKRLLIILLCAILLIQAAPVSAMEYLNNSGSPGEIVSVTFTLLDNPGKATLVTLELVYDHSALELVPNEDFQRDKKAGLQLQYLSELMLTAQFRIRENAASGEYIVELNTAEALDANRNDVKGPVFDNQSVSISSSFESEEIIKTSNTETVYLFDLTEQDIISIVGKLLQEAPGWTKETAPQTLSEFPLLPTENIRNEIIQLEIERKHPEYIIKNVESNIRIDNLWLYFDVNSYSLSFSCDYNDRLKQFKTTFSTKGIGKSFTIDTNVYPESITPFFENRTELGLSYCFSFKNINKLPQIDYDQTYTVCIFDSYNIGIDDGTIWAWFLEDSIEFSIQSMDHNTGAYLQYDILTGQLIGINTW